MKLAKVNHVFKYIPICSHRPKEGSHGGLPGQSFKESCGVSKQEIISSMELYPEMDSSKKARRSAVSLTCW